MLNSKERRNIRNRDKIATGQMCQGCEVFAHCPKRSDPRVKPRIEVHHIEPQQWSRQRNLEPDRVNNLISVCEPFHRSYPDSIHPTYRGFYEVAEGKRIAEERTGEEYWNTEYDRYLKEKARANSIRASLKKWRPPARLKKNEASGLVVFEYAPAVDEIDTPSFWEIPLQLSFG